MDKDKILRMITTQTAQQTGLKSSQVQTIIKQYYDAIWKIVDSMDLENLDKESYKKLKHRAIYIPGLGKFVINKPYIKMWQNKYNKDHVED